MTSLKHHRIFASLPRTERGNGVVLTVDPKGKNFLYTNGNSVFIRSIKEPDVCDVYTEHSFQTTVAKYSPSGFYICSADCTGKIRIWDTVNQEHILKAEYQPFVGAVKDLGWSHDSQRLVVVGEGREKFGAVINMETGTTLGEINGHSKRINTVDFSKGRPFKILTGSDDNSIGVYEGPPFKFKGQLEHHKKYVQVVRFSPDNQLFASGGFDGKVFIYKNGEVVSELEPHKGVINGLDWSKDSSKIFTCAGGDKSVKVLDVETQKELQHFVVGETLNDQQMGLVTLPDDQILTVSLSGHLNFFDSKEGLVKVYRGHNKPITALEVIDNQQVFTGGCDGVLSVYSLKSSEIQSHLTGGHSNQVQDLFSSVDCDYVYSLGLDDLLKRISKKSSNFDHDFQLKLDSQPRSGAVCKFNGEEIIAIACYQHIVIASSAEPKLLLSKQVAFEPNAVSVNNNTSEGLLVAVGGLKDKRVHLYNGIDLTEVTTKEPLLHREAVTCLKFSPDDRFLAVGDGNRKVVVYDKEQDWAAAHQVDWGNHTARVQCLDWFSDNRRIVSGSVDTSLVVWDLDEPMKPNQHRKAHPLSAVNKVKVFEGEGGQLSVVSAGQDSNVKLWLVY